MNDLVYKRIRFQSPQLRMPSALLLLLLGLSIPAVALVTSAGASPALNSIDITVQTTRPLPYQYALTAYNTSGFQVASFYGSYPEAAFGLPAGTYLITASAYYQQTYLCGPTPLAKDAANGTSSSLPIRCASPNA